jgi:hypothetical protein
MVVENSNNLLLTLSIMVVFAPILGDDFQSWVCYPLIPSISVSFVGGYQCFVGIDFALSGTLYATFPIFLLLGAYLLLGGKITPPLSTCIPLRVLLLLGINLINMELTLPLLNLLTMNLPLENLLLHKHQS